MALAHFVVHNIPTEVWDGVRTRAHLERWPLHALCLQLLSDYASGAVAPTIGPYGSSQFPPLNPRVPQRTAVITMRDSRDEHRVQCAAASEAAGNLVLLNQESEVVGRFLSTDVDSWFMED